MNKPLATHSMLITFYNLNEVKTFITDISSFHLDFLKDGLVKISLPKLVNLNFPEATIINVCYTDDPTTNHAGDWVNLGFTRLLFCFEECEKVDSKGFEYVGKLVFKSFNFPERWFDDSNTSELYF